MFYSNFKSEIQKIDSSLLPGDNVSLAVLREDKVHPFVSGNKFRKLKYTIREAQNSDHKTLLTFGGAFSNHIAAVAAAGHALGMKTIGVIRGEELIDKVVDNPTLSFAREHGMRLHFISREEYRKQTSSLFISRLQHDFGPFYLIPEGGTQETAITGCEEILSDLTTAYDYLCVPVGTGGTMAGILNASLPHQTVLGYSALKGTFQKKEIEKYTVKTNFQITDSYCFGGYAKIDSTLVRFINEFKEQTNIPLDPIYVGKMFYGIMDGLKNGGFKENSRILAVHTGGLQGIAGMNLLLKKKKLPQIE